MYHFLSGYTAKVAGTEKGRDGAAGHVQHLLRGAVHGALAHRLRQAARRADRPPRVAVWLVNTGWSGGPYGVGQRMKIAHTRAMVNAALDGRLAGVPMRVDPVFGLAVPTACPDVPQQVLDPRSTWSDPSAYDAQAQKLAGMFRKNFEAFAADAPPEVAAAGPRPAASKPTGRGPVAAGASAARRRHEGDAHANAPGRIDRRGRRAHPGPGRRERPRAGQPPRAGDRPGDRRSPVRRPRLRPFRCARRRANSGVHPRVRAHPLRVLDRPPGGSRLLRLAAPSRAAP